ncbi:MAG: hypothetical protein A2V79_03435 [Betaproteobacteria bacterium RBG_16_56_24]|nr:MAG: hypothetical protein A2V79_03435 [Betaproteobacteria bacterium RBG_16_56_24]
MNKLINSLLVAAALFVGSAAFAEPVPGRDYTLLKQPQPTTTKNIEVLEFFFYGCSHCYHLHPLLSEWEKTMPKDVEMILVPTIFRDNWEPMARTYYALESLGQQQKLHDALYRAWNEDKIDINDEAKVSDFAARHGVDKAKFSAAYNSFSMQSKVTRAKQMIRSYGISGTPSLVVDGKYLINGLQPADTIRVLGEVVAMARKEQKK